MMTFDTFFMVLVILGVCYRMSTLTGVFETEAFLFRVIKGMFCLLLWKGLIWLIPSIGRSFDYNVRDFFTTGVPSIIIMAWILAPWIIMMNRAVKGARFVEIVGWAAVSSVSNFALINLCNEIL